MCACCPSGRREGRCQLPSSALPSLHLPQSPLAQESCPESTVRELALKGHSDTVLQSCWVWRQQSCPGLPGLREVKAQQRPQYGWGKRAREGIAPHPPKSRLIGAGAWGDQSAGAASGPGLLTVKSQKPLLSASPTVSTPETAQQRGRKQEVGEVGRARCGAEDGNCKSTLEKNPGYPEKMCVCGGVTGFFHGCLSA